MSASSDNLDSLPPHSAAAERGVVGCILHAPEESLNLCEREVVREEWFFDLRHRIVWLTARAMRSEGLLVDLVTLQQRLNDNGHLAEAGGLDYLMEHMEKTPSASNLSHYLQICRDKWTLRNLIAECVHTAGQARNFLGSVEALLERQRAKFDQFAQEHINPTQASSLLKPAGDFAESLYNRWFGDGAKIEEPGCLLPDAAFGGFPFRIRTKEMTVVLGKSGQGKTTLLSYLVLHLMAQGMKAVVASMEMAPERTLEVLVRQLVGMARVPDCEAGRTVFAQALAWLNARCLILDFRGIIQYRQLLDEFKRAAANGFNCFTVDNLNKLGLMEEDMSAHGQAANDFYGFSVGCDAALFMVNHVNKAGHSRGSLRWTDVADNWFRVEANPGKWEKLTGGFDLLAKGSISKDEFHDTYRDELKDWDGKFVLGKQRFPGSRQNGSHALWFKRGALQYANHAEPFPKENVNWLEKWRVAKQPK